jgi:hypothetical protein
MKMEEKIKKLIKKFEQNIIQMEQGKEGKIEGITIKIKPVKEEAICWHLL